MQADDIDLPVQIDRDDPTPARTQLLGQLKRVIVDGVLRPGAPIPSSRALARSLGLARSTVLACYLELEGEGYIEAIHGAGTFVAERGTQKAALEVPSSQGGSPTAVDVIDLRPGDLDPALVSGTMWRTMWRAGMPVSAPPPAAGMADLRHALAAYLGSSRGLACLPEEIVLCAGAAEAIVLLAHALEWRSAGPVAVEDPGYPAIREAISMAGVRWTPFDATDGDQYVSAISGLADVPAAVYLTPSHQYPLGHRLSVQARADLLDWSAKSGAVLLEDDYDSEFRFGVPPITSLAGMDPVSSTIYVGTVSKILDPGLRITYLRVPPHLLDRVLLARKAFGPTVSSQAQAGLQLVLTEGILGQHVARVRRAYRDRRRAVVGAAQKLPVETAIRGADAGLHLVIDLPGWVDTTKLARHAERRGVLVATLDEYHVTARPESASLVIGYAKSTPTQIRRAFAQIASLVTAQANERGGENTPN